MGDSGYGVEWYDVSYDSGRNAKGTMHYNVIAQKYKIILKTKNLTKTEAVDFFSRIKILQAHTVTFFDPYTGTTKTIQAYRGDRKMTMKWDNTVQGILYEPVEVNLIEL